MKSHVYTNRYTFLLLPLLLHFTVGSSPRSQENSRIKSKGKIPTSNIQFGPSHPIKFYVSNPIKMVNSANSWEIQKKSYLKKTFPSHKIQEMPFEIPGIWLPRSWGRCRSCDKSSASGPRPGTRRAKNSEKFQSQAETDMEKYIIYRKNMKKLSSKK